VRPSRRHDDRGRIISPPAAAVASGWLLRASATNNAVIGVSIGIAMAPDDGANAEDLFGSAIIAA
jgi:predicted signal transduction protein with EAL and GGDEF domain